MNDHLSGKELFIRFTARAFRKLLSIYVFSYFPFGFEDRMWDLIVSVPDHCLSFLLCPTVNGTTLVFSGYAGGSLFVDPGAAANHICLNPDPIWDHYTEAVDSLARVYGVEYEFFSGNADRPRRTAFVGKSLTNQDAPCNVCQSSRTKILMIPGRNNCYAEWTLEYKGYLVAGHYNHAAAMECMCLDKNPEFNVRGHTDDNAAMLYLVEAVCGSLECPPYINGRELTCAVCSK